MNSKLLFHLLPVLSTWLEDRGFWPRMSAPAGLYTPPEMPISKAVAFIAYKAFFNLPMLQNPPSPDSSGILFHQRFHSIPFGLVPEDPVFGFLLTLHSLQTILSMSIASTLAYKLKPSRLQPYPEFSKPIYSIAIRKLLGCHTNHIQNPFCLPFPPLANNICTQPAGQTRKSIKLLHFNFLVCKAQTSTYIVGLI